MTENSFIIRIKELSKVFGWRGHRKALKFLNKNPTITKEEFQKKTGHILGVKNIKLDVIKSEVLAIMGESGSGKSTLLRLINRLLEPSSGQISVIGKQILSMSQRELRHFRSSHFGMIFQSFAVMPHWTVLDNVNYGLRIRGVKRKEADAIALEWIKKVGLDGYEKRYPSQLSGGMKQRVGTARALAVNPKILLMDEPFSALDPLIRYDLQEELLKRREGEETKPTILIVTHDLEEALRVGDRIAILHQGEIEQVGTPEEIIYHSETDHVKEFVKNVNRLRLVKARDIYIEPPCMVKESEKVEILKELMEKKAYKKAYIIDTNGKCTGTIVKSNLMHQEPNIRLRKLKNLFKPLDIHVGKENLLELLPSLIESDKDIPIINALGIFLGIVNRKTIIKALCKS